MAGADCCLLQPASGAPFYLRLIEGPPQDHYAPLKTYGWNSAELHVDDIAQTVKDLHGSEFTIIGGPRDLLNNGKVIAVQVIGPNDELFYLTQISGKKMQASYGKAECGVDRLFIVVLGARDHAATLTFFRDLGTRTTRPRNFAIRVLAEAHGLDPGTHQFGIAAACLPNQFRIEIDDYPDTACRRTIRKGQLPPGLCMVSFDVDSLDSLPVGATIFRGPNEPPYDSCRFARIIGPNDEWIELLERKPAA